MTTRTRVKKVRHVWDDNYKELAFRMWWEKGRPNNRELHMMLPENEEGNKPPAITLQNWIYDSFKKRAISLDEQVMEELDETSVALKVEMLQRHTEIGKELQNMGLKALRNLDEELLPATATKLVKEGVRIERDSIGIAKALEKLVALSDEELLKEVADLLETSPGKLEAGGDDKV